MERSRIVLAALAGGGGEGRGTRGSTSCTMRDGREILPRT